MRASLLKLTALGVVALGAVALVGATSVPLQAADPSAVGVWEQVDENSGKPESWFKIIAAQWRLRGQYREDLLQAR